MRQKAGESKPIITVKHVFLGNRKVEYFYDGKKVDEGTWKICGEEVVVESSGLEKITRAYKIESNGDLTVIALIVDGNRGDYPIEDPAPYQNFFTSLSKAMFLEAHGVD